MTGAIKRRDACILVLGFIVLPSLKYSNSAHPQKEPGPCRAIASGWATSRALMRVITALTAGAAALGSMAYCPSATAWSPLAMISLSFFSDR
jgi:hypothetical protein